MTDEMASSMKRVTDAVGYTAPVMPYMVPFHRDHLGEISRAIIFFYIWLHIVQMSRVPCIAFVYQLLMDKLQLVAVVTSNKRGDLWKNIKTPVVS